VKPFNAGALCFGRDLRLRKAAEFRRLLSHGRRMSDAHLQVWALPNTLGRTRIGLIVGRRHGGAVRRNAIKRRIREAFRHVRADLPKALDLAVSPVPGTPPSTAAYAESLKRLAARLARRFPETSSPDASSCPTDPS
jgi:ribonuclease P protein component